MDIDPLFLDDDSFPPGDGNLNSVTSSRSVENSTSASQSRSQSSTAQKSYASTLLDDIVGLPPELQDGNDAIADDEIELSAQEVKPRVLKINKPYL